MKNAPKPPPLQPVEEPIAIVLHVHKAAPDELVAYPFGLEAGTARALVASGELTTRKLGRKLYARRSAVLALVDDRPAPPPADARAELVQRVRRGGRR